MVNNNSSGVMGPTTAGRISVYGPGSASDARYREWGSIVDRLESLETSWELFVGLGTFDLQRIMDIGAPVKEFLDRHYPNHGASPDLLRHYTASAVIRAQLGAPAAAWIGLAKESVDHFYTIFGLDVHGYSLDDLAANFAGFVGYTPGEALEAGLLAHTESDADWTTLWIQGNWGDNIKKVIELMDPTFIQSEADRINSSVIYKEMFDIHVEKWGSGLFLPPGVSDSQSTRGNDGSDYSPYARGGSQYPHTYADFGVRGWNDNGFDGGSISELNAAALNVTCRLSHLGKPLGKQEGWIYNGRKTTTITPESLGWTDSSYFDPYTIQKSINDFQTSVTSVMGTFEDIKYAPGVIKNEEHDIFQPYKATSYTIEADHYTYWYWVPKYDAEGNSLGTELIHSGPKTLCNGKVLEGPGPNNVPPAETFPEFLHDYEKWTDDSYLNAVITGIGHDDVIKLYEDDSDFIPEPPTPIEPPIPEPPITVTEYGDTIPLTKRPKSKGGTRYKVVDDYEVVDCNGNILPKSNFILTEHNGIYVLRPPECEITVNVTWKEPEPLSNPDAFVPPEFDPALMAILQPSGLFLYRNYEEFIKFRKEIAGSYYEGFDLMGDSPAGMTEWTAALQAQADLEWNDLLNMMSGYEDDFTNYTYTPGAGDFIYDAPHIIHTVATAAEQFGDYVNAEGAVEDWSGIPTNTNIPSTIRNVSSVTSGVVDGGYIYDKVTFEHDCPPCAEDLTTYPSNTWLKYEVYYNGVAL